MEGKSRLKAQAARINLGEGMGRAGAVGMHGKSNQDRTPGGKRSQRSLRYLTQSKVPQVVTPRVDCWVHCCSYLASTTI